MKKKLYYGWFVCIGCALTLFCTSGLCVNAFTIYQPYILMQNGFTNAQSSGIITVRSVFSFASMLLTGAYYKKLSLRSGMLAAGLLCALGFVLFGAAGGIAGYYAAAAVTGLGYGFGTMIPVSMLLERWFMKNRTLAIGLCAAVTGLSTMGIPSLIAWSVEAHGLRTTFLFEAAIVAGLSAVSFALIRSHPREKGWSLARAGEEIGGNASALAAQKVLLRRSDWLGLSVMLLLLGAMTSVGYSHLSVLMTGQGFTTHTAALAIGISGVTLTVSKCLYGMLSKRLSVQRRNLLFGAVLVAGYVFLCAAQGSTARLFAGAAGQGFGLALTTVGLTEWAGDFSAPEEYDCTIRRFNLGYAAGGLVFSPLPGIMADRAGGSYVPAYIFFTLCSAAVVLTVMWLYKFRAVGRTPARLPALPRRAGARVK